MITLEVNGTKATAHVDEPITTGSVGLPVSVTLSEGFDDLAVIVVFRAGTVERDIAYAGEFITVPAECLAQSGIPLEIGVYGANAAGDRVMPTIWAPVGTVRQGVKPSGVDPSDPTPSWAAQVQQLAEDAHDIAERVAEEVAGWRGELIWDETAGCYTNQSITAMLAAQKNSLAYGVSVPKGSSIACTKIGANAGIAAPTPGYIGSPAIDPYAQLGPFAHYDVNGYVDDDGTPHVTAIEGDGNFKRDGSNGNVWVLAPVLYWLHDESGENAVVMSISDTRLAGMEAQPQAYLPDGSMRPYMLYAKYAGSNDGNGMMASVSGKAPWNFNVSHDSLITQCKNASTGYSGKSIADDWYVKTMFFEKYATKNSQSVFTGCTNYDFHYNPAVAETGVTRVILTKAQAANLIVGSSMMLGTHAGASSTDRNVAANHDVFSNCRILKIEDYDSANSAVYFDTADTFDTETTYLLSTAPWFSGSLDAVEGDGTLTEAGRTNSHEPFKIQGIECMVGLYETLGDVVLHSDGSTGWEVCVNHDSRNESTSVTADYTHTGKYLASGETDTWHYPMYPGNADGLLYGAGEGASQTTGMCDGSYTNKTATAGDREWLGLGDLYYAGNAGLWYVTGYNGLGNGHWIFGSRLSGTGRGRAAA